MVRLEFLRDLLQIPDVARLPQDGSVADHRNATRIELRQMLDDQIRQTGYPAIVFGVAGFVVEDRYADEPRPRRRGRLDARPIDQPCHCGAPYKDGDGGAERQRNRRLARRSRAGTSGRYGRNELESLLRNGL